MGENKVHGAVRGIDNFFEMTGQARQFDSIDDLYAAIDFALSNLPFIKDVDDTTLEAIRLELQYKYQIKNADPGHSIQFDYDAPKWYTEKLNEGKINPEFWNRYRNYLMDEKGFATSIVDDLENKTLNAELMNFLADPDGEPGIPRRGLIIGDVQSGKTSTYTGLICKAADAGYKVFIILAGMIESLRVQTQQRIEEGFVGVDLSTGKAIHCGVGNDNKPPVVESMTSRKTDFTRNINQIAMTLRGKRAVVFVLKKNTSVLTKLLKWLKDLNLDPLTGKINEPMLLIDDEADNASINTNAGEDPTRINGLIRQLIDLFSISNYVGFTATPFANVFIDPLTEHDMFKHDLFPEDFIVALPTPQDYVGARKIFHLDGVYHKQLIYIEDAGIRENDGYSFYYLHKKNWDGDLPESLTDALYAFYLANAIRDLKGHTNAHRTMMVNITRFTAVQYRIRDKMKQWHEAARRAIRYNLSPDNAERSLQDPILKHIYDVYMSQYADSGYSWADISRVLLSAVDPIEFKVVNSSKQSDKLVYSENDPQRVVAVGGLALSRGLTLEGLIISYFYRNTSTYDVLMQMGRWFGYRRNYDSLFRIWLSKQSADWYSEISDATDQLKKDMDTMRQQRKRPRDFGIRVRDDSEELEITARNKMRNAGIEYDYSSYFGNYIETPYLTASVAEERDNCSFVMRMLREARNDGASFAQSSDGRNSRVLITGVQKKRIVELLAAIHLPDCNIHFDTRQLVDFLTSPDAADLDLWDVVVISGKDKPTDIEGYQIAMVKRTHSAIYQGRLNVGSRGRLGGTKDGRIGVFNQHLLDRAEQTFKDEYKQKYNEDYEGDSYTSYTWFRYISTKERRPLLLLYPLVLEFSKDPNLNAESAAFTEALGDTPVFGFGVGIPINPNAEYVERSRYKVNSQYNFYGDGVDDIDQEGQE